MYYEAMDITVLSAATIDQAYMDLNWTFLTTTQSLDCAVEYRIWCYTEILEVNLLAFAYRLLHEDLQHLMLYN